MFRGTALFIDQNVFPLLGWGVEEYSTIHFLFVINILYIPSVR